MTLRRTAFFAVQVSGLIIAGGSGSVKENALNKNGKIKGLFSVNQSCTIREILFFKNQNLTGFTHPLSIGQGVVKTCQAIFFLRGKESALIHIPCRYGTRYPNSFDFG